MHDTHYYGMPDISNLTPQQAIMKLYEHCDQTARLLDTVNKEVEELKRQVVDLSLRVR
jgi:hypothetical protein